MDDGADLLFDDLRVPEPRRLGSGRGVERVLASTSVCFDLSVYELMWPLSEGKAVVLVENVLGMRELEEEVELVNTVPSALWELLRGWRLPGPLAPWRHSVTWPVGLFWVSA